MSDISILATLSKDSPLIGWLVPKLPMLAKSIVLALLISLLASRIAPNAVKSPLRLVATLFIITTVTVSHAPKLLNSIEHGIGFAIAILLLGEASPFFNKLKMKTV
jgi:hypothetical protein